LDEFVVHQSDAIRHWTWAPVIVVALGMAVRMRLSLDRRFVVTPLDLLVIIVAAVVPDFPGFVAGPRALGAGGAQMVVVFYGIETLSVVSHRQWRWLSSAAFVIFTICAVRGA